MCDLLLAQLDDLIAGRESWNEAGRRSIRIDELGRELWPADMPARAVEADEATFSWRLYRHFGKMMELGSVDRTPASLREYRALMASIDQYRRPDTLRFIDAVRQSADRWLAHPSPELPWIAGYDFRALGPDGLGEVLKLWGRDATLWGAELDDEDRRAIKADLARHTEAADAANSNEPDAPAPDEPAPDPAGAPWRP
jgi:hypothetical protein